MEYGNGKTNQLVWKTNQNRYHNAEFHVDQDNINVNVAMLSKYIDSGDYVLDIGCGEGKLGSILKSKNCKVYGVDLDIAACQSALQQGNYEEIFEFNIEHVDEFPAGFQKLKDKKISFDAVALIDILEHVINPTQVLLNVLPLIKENGKILISIPNVNNADIFLNLLRDHFNYREAGVLDNTHTKYFTKQSFVEWIKDVNDQYKLAMDCMYVGSTYAFTEYMEQIQQEKPHVYSFIQMNPYFHVMQHLFVLAVNQSDGKTDHLCSLLTEEKWDLTDVLEKALSHCDSQEKLFENVSLLPNERKIMEEQIQTANAGWKKCAAELEIARTRITSLENELASASAFLESEEANIRTLKQANLKAEDEITHIKNKWEECAQDLKESQKGWNEAKQASEENKRRWMECAEALDAAKSGWEECAEALEMARNGWKECAEALDMARSGWKECADALEVARSGWKECAEALDMARSGWKECADALKEAKHET